MFAIPPILAWAEVIMIVLYQVPLLVDAYALVVGSEPDIHQQGVLTYGKAAPLRTESTLYKLLINFVLSGEYQVVLLSR